DGLDTGTVPLGVAGPAASGRPGGAHPAAPIARPATSRTVRVLRMPSHGSYGTLSNWRQTGGNLRVSRERSADGWHRDIDRLGAVARNRHRPAVVEIGCVGVPDECVAIV